MERNDEPRLAVLIDADNTAPKWAEAIFEEIATLGEASVRRIYGDFSGLHLRSWVTSRVRRSRRAGGLRPHRGGVGGRIRQISRLVPRQVEAFNRVFRAPRLS